jgi:hypothetical protein
MRRSSLRYHTQIIMVSSWKLFNDMKKGVYTELPFIDILVKRYHFLFLLCSSLDSART